MPHTFRLHNNPARGTLLNTGWQSIDSYLNDGDINSIFNPHGDNSLVPITSIPSPFAQLDLFRTAFRFLNNQFITDGFACYNGNTFYHRLVSFCFDTAELFFFYHIVPNSVIQIFNIAGGMVDLRVLSRKFYNTFNDYLISDADSLNLNPALGFNNFYFFLINNNLIGATSPITLFFSAPIINLDNLANFKIGRHKFFRNVNIQNPTDTYYPLHSRNLEFLKYIYYLRYNRFFVLLPELETYLDNLLPSNENLQHYVIANIQIQPDWLVNQHHLIDINYNPNHPGMIVEHFGNPFKCYNPIHLKIHIRDNSSFTLGDTKSKIEYPPLFLYETAAQNLIYALDRWEGSNIIPPYNTIQTTPINDRTLPDQSINYPYIVVDDFLSNDLYYDPVTGIIIFPIKTKVFTQFYGIEILNNANLIYNLQPNGKHQITLNLPKRNNPGHHFTLTKIYDDLLPVKGAFHNNINGINYIL